MGARKKRIRKWHQSNSFAVMSCVANVRPCLCGPLQVVLIFVLLMPSRTRSIAWSPVKYEFEYFKIKCVHLFLSSHLAVWGGSAPNSLASNANEKIKIHATCFERLEYLLTHASHSTQHRRCAKKALHRGISSNGWFANCHEMSVYFCLDFRVLHYKFSCNSVSPSPNSTSFKWHARLCECFQCINFAATKHIN